MLNSRGNSVSITIKRVKTFLNIRDKSLVLRNSVRYLDYNKTYLKLFSKGFVKLLNFNYLIYIL